ncbi:MAG: hypothetical protein AAF433_16115 [Bacteroidota bacterium]
MSNNFNKLGLYEQERFRASGAEKNIRNRIEGTLGTLQMIGAVLEVYLPRMADTVVGLTGGDPTPLDDSDDVMRLPSPENPGEAPMGPQEPRDPTDLR